MGTYKRKDDILCLEIQLGDGDNRPATRVFARIEELDGTLLEPEFELSSIGDGSYTDQSKIMPALDCVKVLYFIRKNATTPSNFYDPNFLSEIFMRDLTGEIIKENLDTKISGSQKPSSSISTVIEKDKLSATINEVKISAIVRENKITGVVHEC